MFGDGLVSLLNRSAIMRFEEAVRCSILLRESVAAAECWLSPSALPKAAIPHPTNRGHSPSDWKLRRLLPTHLQTFTFVVMIS